MKQDGVFVTVDETMYTSKSLNVAIPDIQLSSSQLDELQQAIEYAQSFGINITTTIVK
ncbi:hypothetical protein D3C84_1075400 [compost metagenome]